MKEAGTLPVNVTIPKGSMLERIEESYGPLADAVRCGLSDCGTPHKKGYVVAFSVDENALSQRGVIGHVCGRREFGETWKKAIARHSAELRDAETRAELEQFLGSIVDIEPRLLQLLPGLEICYAVRQILLIDARDFMRQCIDACRNHNGKLSYFGLPYYQLVGQQFFLAADTLHKTKRILHGIAQVRGLADQSGTTPRILREHLSRFRNLRLNVEAIEIEAKDNLAALNPTNFLKAIRVLDPKGQGKLRMNGTILQVQRALVHNDWAKVVDLANLEMPEKATLWSY